MKRIKKVLHAALVWTAICLLLVDPASACRLLSKRCCCCPCVPPACSDAALPAPAAPAEPSPSDAPPGVSLENQALPAPPAAASVSDGPLFTEPAVVSSPSIERGSQPAAVDAAGLGSATDRELTEQAIVPGVYVPARPAAPAELAVPSSAPLPAAAATRQPSELKPTVDSSASLPTGNLGDRTIASSADATPTPMPLPLTPKQTFAPEAHAPPMPDPQSPAGFTVQPEARGAKHPAETPAIPEITGPAHATTRSTANPLPVKPGQAISPPAFAPVNDDPFAPLPAANRSPAVSQPDADDPFAPLKPAQPTKSSAPIAAEPTTLKLADALVPDASGRLPLRQWSDNSGQFRVQARLVLILDGKVRLLKESGRTTTVPTARLSAADQQYVAEVVSRYGSDLTKLDQLAAR